MNWWTVAWVLWGLMFFVIEIPAIKADHRDTAPGPKKKSRTLSLHFRRWFNVKVRIGRTIWVIVSSVFAGLFIVHITGAGLAW